jgi:arginine/lysine/ornithine decarboxylase
LCPGEVISHDIIGHIMEVKSFGGKITGVINENHISVISVIKKC